MRNSLRRWSAIAIVLGPMAGLAAGCVATGGGYGYADQGGYAGDYYEPYGYDYGYWDQGYGVAPYRYGDHRGGRGGTGGSHSYRSAPASHAAPSLPSAPRSGGRRSH